MNKMIINRLLKISLIILSLVFIFFSIFQDILYIDLTSTLLLVVFTILYVRQKKAIKKQKPYFLLFLIFFGLSEFIALLSNFVDMYIGSIDYTYYIGNIFFMLAYFFLILRCVLTMRFKKILKNFPVTIIILIVLSIFCVTLITETAQNQLSAYEYITEFLYNVVIMTLLSVALINYMDKSDNKSILFLIGCMLIFFSEMLQLAYYYIEDLPHLAAIYSFFMVLAFGFFYSQACLKHEKQPEFNFLDYKS
ncbi:hypothetical protein ACFQ1Q_10365 [Winogradskyella litorisediminis]|uniref:YhhN-like protein n=1 Tax=Winogradskyella litorisediminis TaxID=1156618 RepID=A0ABW3N7H5_9FLAO